MKCDSPVAADLSDCEMPIMYSVQCCDMQRCIIIVELCRWMQRWDMKSKKRLISDGMAKNHRLRNHSGPDVSGLWSEVFNLGFPNDERKDARKPLAHGDVI